MATELAIPGQPEAERLLNAALRGTPSHAYLVHGPRGSGMERAVEEFVAALLDTTVRRVETEAHPDLSVLEPEGEQHLVEHVHELRRDLHMRPFESARRVYVLREAERLGNDAANALLKDLEEPPSYVVFVLVAESVGSVLPTIVSRCQPVPFRRLPRSVVERELTGEGLDPLTLEEVVAAARGNLELARRLARSADARARRGRILDIARAAALTPSYDAPAAAAEIMTAATARGDEVEQEVDERFAEARAFLRERERDAVARKELNRLERRAEELKKRLRRRAETDEVRFAVDTIASFWRDVLCVAVEAEDAVVSSARLDDLRAVAREAGPAGAEAALACCRDVRRSLHRPVAAWLALDRLLIETASTARPAPLP